MRGLDCRSHPLGLAGWPCLATRLASPMAWQDKGLGFPFQQGGRYLVAEGITVLVPRCWWSLRGLCCGLKRPHCGCGLSGSVNGLGKVPGQKAVSALGCY